tara:strand:+ start:96 stop:539 length:444 start_codon:yes stop_codon:yes gene_type:complete
MIKVNVILDYSSWKKKIRNPNIYFKKKIQKLSSISYFRKKQEFSILLTNNKKMKKLNFKFRKKNKTTDILSFPLKYLKNKKLYIGDIAISYEIINQRSKLSNFSVEFDKIWIHGFLHLIGYDHKKLKDFKKMQKKEQLILNHFYKIN